MYGKHFASMYTGSMFGAGADVFAVWGYVIAHAWKSQVELNPKVIAVTIGMSEERVQSAIDTLCQPDTHSRTKEQEGKRLVKIGQFAYEVPSWEKYHKMRDADAQRESSNERKRKSREKLRNKRDVTFGHARSHLVTGGHVSSLHTDTDTDTEKEKKKHVADKPRPDGKKAGKERGGWVGRLTSYHDQTTGASVQPAHVGKVLKPLVERYGEERVFTAWQAWCAEEERFSVNYFASHFGKFDGVAVVKSGAALFPGMYFKD